MKIQVHTLPAFDDNYIWLIGCDDSTQVTAVDPGDAGPVLAYLQRQGLTLEAILITHHHHDHTGGIAGLLARYPVPVYGPSNERVEGLSHPLREGENITLCDGRLTFTTIETPGHTRGHLCYYGEGVLFSGDTLFTAGCGRLFEGTPAQMHASLEKLRRLPDTTLVYCAHEYTEANLRFARIAEPGNRATEERQCAVSALRQQGVSSVPEHLAVEKASNPFLRTAVPSVIAAAERFVGHSLDGPAAVFATVRHWKDTLD